jgi:hypothetical protein
MTISAASVLVGGTVSATGGTATTFVSKGNTLNEHRVVLDDSSEFVLSTKLEFKVREPQVQTSAPNGYTQKRSTVKCLKPLLLDNGSYTTNSFDIGLSVDVETTETEIAALRSLLAQIATDADYDSFWNDQSVG